MGLIWIQPRVNISSQQETSGEEASTLPKSVNGRGQRPCFSVALVQTQGPVPSPLGSKDILRIPRPLPTFNWEREPRLADGFLQLLQLFHASAPVAGLSKSCKPLKNVLIRVLSPLCLFFMNVLKIQKGTVIGKADWRKEKEEADHPYLAGGALLRPAK